MEGGSLSSRWARKSFSLGPLSSFSCFAISTPLQAPPQAVPSAPGLPSLMQGATGQQCKSAEHLRCSGGCGTVTRCGWPGETERC